MDPGDFAVPGTLLRTAGGGSNRDGAEPGREGDVPVFVRAHWWDGVAPALIVLGLLGAGILPAVSITVIVVTALAIVALILLGPALAFGEERSLRVAAGLDPDAELAPAPRGGPFVIAQRLARRRGIRDLLVLAVPVGTACFAVPRFAGRIFTHDMHLSDNRRLLYLGVAIGSGALLSPLAALFAGDLTRELPDGARMTAGVATGWICLFFGLAAIMPSENTVAAFLAAGALGVVPMARAASRCLNATVSIRHRGAAWLLLATYGLLVGGLVGTTALGLIDRRTDPRVALVLLAPVGLAAGAWVAVGALRNTTRHESADFVATVIERRNAQERLELGVEPPAIEVVGVDFAYGAQPVLRDVSLEVWSGEVVAMLGTNGAGKSTLLRAIAGLVVPSRGTVRLFGEPTDVIGPEELGRRNISMVLGGGMTFPGLTVAETLRLSVAGLADADHVEQVYGRFPVLWERRDQRTGTLSGGEQQMLALGRALLTRPKLCLIDELTLGLAPKIVAQLVELVEEINERGATVVLVEQSVNVATSLASHAFFMERGQIRFDGPIDDLLDRDDLLRSVFLAATPA